MPPSQNEFILSITSQDRIGIVHDIAGAIADLQGNIADSRQSVMSGYYIMILRAAFPVRVSQHDIEVRLARVSAESPTPMNILVNKMNGEPEAVVNEENVYVLTASGADQVGFVARVAGFCVEHRINILDLSTTLKDGEFVMMLEVDLSRCESISAVRQALAEFGSLAGLKVTLQHHDIFKALNEIALPIRSKRE